MAATASPVETSPIYEGIIPAAEESAPMQRKAAGNGMFKRNKKKLAIIGGAVAAGVLVLSLALHPGTKKAEAAARTNPTTY